VEEVDQILVSIASHTKNSSESVRQLAAGCKNRPITALYEVFNRLQPREVKWLTRLLLKNTGLVTVPADFGVSSYQSQLPNCVSVHIEIPNSTSTTLQLGKTGTIRVDSLRNRAQSKFLESQSHRRALGSLQSSFQPDRDPQRRRDLKNRKKDISRPSSPPNTVDRPVSVSLESASATPHSALPTAKPSPNRSIKRRRNARNISPDALVFQRGVLQPIQSTSITSNCLRANKSILFRSQQSAVDSGRASFGDENSYESTVWASGGSLGKPLTMVFEDDLLTKPKSVTRNNGDDRLHLCSSEPSRIDIAKNELLSRGGLLLERPFVAATNHLQTHPSSNAIVSSPIKELRAIMDSKRRSPPTLPVAQLKTYETANPSCMILPLSEEPSIMSAIAIPATARSTKLARRTNLSAVKNGNHGTSPGRDLGRQIRASPFRKPACALSTATCPLTNCIFLIPPTLPSIAKDRLITNLLPLHGCIYLTSINELANTALPRRCSVTGRKFRKIVLIERNEIEESKRILKQIDGLKLTRTRNRKVWVECFDWRLIDDIAKRELKTEESGVNIWKCHWIGAI
jgi:hypothetical protein